jgi:hypothetical protein
MRLIFIATQNWHRFGLTGTKVRTREEILKTFQTGSYTKHIDTDKSITWTESKKGL